MADSKLSVAIQQLKDRRAIEEAGQASDPKVTNGYEAVKFKDKGDEWLSRWEMVYDYRKPGVSDEGILAFNGEAYLSDAFASEPELYAKTVYQYVCSVFGKDNILSFRVSHRDGEDSGEYCHFLVFPQEGRQLTPRPWIDSRSQKLLPIHARRFNEAISESLGIDIHDRDVVMNGHTEYLDNFPKVQFSQEDIQEIYYNTITEESQVQTDAPVDKIRRISNETVREFTTGIEKGSFIKLNNGDISIEQYLRDARLYLDRVHPGLSKQDSSLILKKLRSAATGFYILDDLINDIRISDIKTVGPNKIRVKVEGARKTSNLRFLDAQDYFRFLDGLITRYGLDPEKQIHVFTDTESNANYKLRCNLTLGDINSGYPVLHIRKIPKSKYSIEELIEYGMMDETTANYLVWAAREAKGMVFTGKGSSGKTTVMNTLLEYVPRNASGLVIQESDELYSGQPEFTFEQITEGYDLKALAKNGLLTDIDYYIIGEVKGEEAMYFINACDTGNKAWCSVHSPSSTEAINKLADYVMYASKYNHEEALYMLKELQVVVFLKNFKVAEISEVVGWDEDRKNLKYRTVFHREDLILQAGTGSLR